MDFLDKILFIIGCANAVTGRMPPRPSVCRSGYQVVRRADGGIADCGGFVGKQCPRTTDRCEYFPSSDIGECCRRIHGQVKPGRCPRPTGVGTCDVRCFSDASCPGRQKCCSNGCGRACMRPRGGGHGPVKPGRCPPPRLGQGTCDIRCFADIGCPGRQKCCSNGCGRACMRPMRGQGFPASVAVQSVDTPVIGGDILTGSGVDPLVGPLVDPHVDPLVDPHVDPLVQGLGYLDTMAPASPIEPPMVLGGYLQPDCNGIVCPEVSCDDQYIPAGQCCNACRY